MSGIQSHLGPPPAHRATTLSPKSREQIDSMQSKSLDLAQYLRLAYAQDHIQLLGIEAEEEEILIEEYEKARCEFGDGEISALSAGLAGLLVYHPASRGTPEALLRSSWFGGIDDEERGWRNLLL